MHLLDRRIMSLALFLAGLLALAFVQHAAAQNPKGLAEMEAGVLELDETVISGNQELPKVLYILPWRDPQGLPDIEIQADSAASDVFRRLYPPAYRRELQYVQTLESLDRGEAH